MRNKGFFWFITILLTAVCIYQLSFTWVASNEESRAEKQAQQKVIELKAQATQKILCWLEAKKAAIIQAQIQVIIHCNGVAQEATAKDIDKGIFIIATVSQAL